MRRKVCHISTAHNENDSRILLKECNSLSKNGYEVYYVVTSDKEKKLYGVNIIPLDKRIGRIYRIFIKRKEAYKKALEIDADIYHFHDPELIPIGKKLKRVGKKVIYDVHEDVPKQILNKTYLGNIYIRKLIAYIFDIYEKISVKKFDAVIGAIDEISNKFKDIESISVKNYAAKDILDGVEAIKYNKEGKLIAIYVGAISEIRGIKEVINAIDLLDGKVELWILGSWESKKLFEECKTLNGYKYCKYFGYLKLNEVYKYIKAADIGLCVLHPVENYKESIPIKVMEYMTAGLPVISSDFNYWRNIFGDIGTYVNPYDYKEIANSIKQYINNDKLVKTIGDNNRKKIDEKLNWGLEEKKLLKLYKDLYLL